MIGLALLLKVRTYVDATRRIGLAIAAIVCAAGCFAVAVASGPDLAHWISVLAAAVGIGALSPLFGLTVSPVVRRAVELVEYLALAAVVPPACWVGGLYRLRPRI